jgi:hypothetical protein
MRWMEINEATAPVISELDALVARAKEQDILLRVYADEREIELEMIMRGDSPKGSGRQIMSELCSIADQHKMPIVLYAYAADDKLMDYYGGFGFEVDQNKDDEAWMIRQPRSNLTERIKLTLGERIKVFFEQKGFRLIGQGHFSNVYSNGKNVVKVYRNDPAYEKYLSVIEQSPSDHFPKVISGPQAIGSDLKMVRMERLRPVTKEQYNMFATAWGSVDLYGLEENWFLKEHPEMAELAKACKMLQEALPKDVIPGSGRMWHDIKPDNILQRSDGTIVIADPFAI